MKQNKNIELKIWGINQRLNIATFQLSVSKSLENNHLYYKTRKSIEIIIHDCVELQKNISKASSEYDEIHTHLTTAKELLIENKLNK